MSEEISRTSPSLNSLQSQQYTTYEQGPEAKSNYGAGDKTDALEGFLFYIKQAIEDFNSQFKAPSALQNQSGTNIQQPPYLSKQRRKEEPYRNQI